MEFETCSLRRQNNRVNQLLEVKGLYIGYKTYIGKLKVLNGVDFMVHKGETVSYTHLTLPTNREV